MKQIEDKIKEMTLEEFDKLYMFTQEKREWDFSLFKIVCKKCNSDNVEYAGKTAVEEGYYGSISVEHKIIIKCHDCGNATVMKVVDGGSTNYCPD